MRQTIEAALDLDERRVRLLRMQDVPETSKLRGRSTTQTLFGRDELELAIERDEIAATRPNGCWCLGVGGRREMWCSADVAVFSEYCTCAEGERQRERDDEARHKKHLADAVVRAELFIDALPLRLQRFSISTYPTKRPEQKALIEQLVAWRVRVSDGPEDEEDPDDLVKQWLLLWGPYGCGKTGLAVAMAAEVLRFSPGHRTAKFIAVPALLDRLRRSFGSEGPSSNDLVEELLDVDVLVLDDIGSERSTDWVLETLFTIINHRYDEEKVTIFTSNLPPAELAVHLGERTMWRIAESAAVVDLSALPNLRAPAPKPAAVPDRSTIVRLQGKRSSDERGAAS